MVGVSSRSARRAERVSERGRTGMSFAKALQDARVLWRPSAIVICAVALTGCDSISSLNPFDTTGKYKMEIVPEVPAEQIYNQGLGRIQNRDFEGAAKKFADLDKQYPYSE